MNQWTYRWLAAAWLAILPPGSLGAPYNLTQVAQGVYVHQGVHEDYTAVNAGDIANAGFIVGHRCVAVLDTGGSPQGGRALHAALKGVTRLPICYVINSHAHPDHVLGNSAFADDHPTYIGHAGLADALRRNRDYFLEHYVQPLRQGESGELIIFPGQSVAQRMELDLGERIIRLTAHRKAHSDTDLSVLDLNTKTLWLADLLFVGRIPALDGSLRGWLSVMAELRSTDAERVVPGHGPASAPWPQALDPQQRYLQALAEGVAALLAKGGVLEQALEQVGYAENEHWLLFDEYHKRNVTRAFAELEWE